MGESNTLMKLRSPLRTVVKKTHILRKKYGNSMIKMHGEIICQSWLLLSSFYSLPIAHVYYNKHVCLGTNLVSLLQCIVSLPHSLSSSLDLELFPLQNVIWCPQDAFSLLNSFHASLTVRLSKLILSLHSILL